MQCNLMKLLEDLSFFAKGIILDVWLDSEYVSNRES